jgi:hypothetical protein
LPLINSRDENAMTEADWQELKRILKKYHRQLGK